MAKSGTVGNSVRTKYRVVQRTLIVDLGGPRRVLSSAPKGGGLTVVSYILNHQVEAGGFEANRRPTRFPVPARFLNELALQLGIGPDTVGLMTAVPMTQLVTARASAGHLWVECFATVGVTNAVRAGEWPGGCAPRQPWALPGTINLILITNGSLSHAAMVGAVQVATEAKTGLLLDYAVLSRQSGAAATGTGTDVVAIACPLRGLGPPYRYSGTHTIIGALIGRVVADSVARGLAKAMEWQEAHR